MEKRLHIKLYAIFLLLCIYNMAMANPTAELGKNENKTPHVATYTITPTAESCPGANDGTVAYTISGLTGTTGTAVTAALVPTVSNGTNDFVSQNLTINSTGSVSGTFTNQIPRDYIIQFLAGNSQNGSSNIFTVAAGDLAVQVNPTSPTCNGGTDGIITLAGSGGTAPYSYSLDGSKGQASGDFTGLEAGNYTILIEDATGCEVTQTYQLTEPDALTATLTETPLTCNGDNSGSITVQASGGNGTYEYSTDGTNFSSSSTLTGLAAGSYTVTIRDGNNCTGTATITVTEPAAMTATLDAVTNISCNGASDGSFSISITGGTAPYVILDAIGNPVVQVSGNVYTSYNVPAQNNPAGSIRDANGCTVAFPNLTVSEPSAITVTIPTRQNMSCNNIEDGSITASATGGAGGPYEYSIDGVNFQVSNIFENLDAGSYFIIARDANNCTGQSASTPVYEPLPILGSINVDSNVTTCGANDGAFTVTASGHFSSTTFEYSIDGGTTYQSSASFTGLAAGNYDVTVKNIGGTCTILLNTTITDPVAITATASQTDILCNGGSTGIIDISNVAGGTAPYEYSLDGTNYQTSNTFTNLTAGTYTITIKDAGNCTNTLSTTLLEADLIQPVVTVTDARCNGDAGSLSVTASGGTGPYEYSLDGTTFGAGTFTGLVAGNYTVTIRDASLCTTTTTATVSEPTAITGTFSTTDVTCNGGSDGAFTITAIGGVAPYNYSLDGGNSFGTPFSSSTTLSNLAAGNYNIILIDANNCTEAVSTSISEPAAISATYQALPPSCIGGTDGRININLASGGTAPLKIRLLGTTALDFSISNLSPGDYDVEMVDANGCTVVSSVTVPEAAPVTADVTIDANASGCGNADGAFTLSNPKKGTGINLPTVQYSIDGVNFQSNPSFTGLAAGVYTVTVKDVSGTNSGTGQCQGTVSVTITEPSGITATASESVPIACNGGTGAVIIANVAGGTAPYEYSIDGINFVGSGSVAYNFTNLSAGSYNITVKDASGCTASIPISLTEPDALTATLTPTDISCNGAGDGSVSLSISGGTAPYYWLDVSTFGANNFQTINGTTATYNAVAGSRTGNDAVIVDGNGCLIQLPFTINEPSPLAASITNITDVTCNGGTDGTVTITATGGTAPYEATADGTQYFPLASDGIVTGIGAVTIANITVRDANGCDVTIAGFTVNEPDPIMADIVATAVSCNGDSDGTVTITPTTATGTSFEYSIDGTNFSASNTFNQLSSGSYTITVRETGTSCENTFNVTVAEPDILEVGASAVDVTCNGQEDGQIIGSATGGTAPYEYSIDGGNTYQTQDFTGLDIGTYDVIARDANGCIASKPVTIAEPAELVLNISSITDVSCNGLSDGTATEMVTGGTTPYSYSLDAQNFSSTIDLTALAAGSYTLTVQDANNCQQSASFTINEPAAIVPVISTSIDISCNGLSDGSFTVTATGGDGTFMYSMDGTNFSATNSFANLAAGTYTVTVQDGSGCIATVMQTITEPAVLNLQFEAVDITCNGAGDGQIAGIATGGTAPYTYSIDGTSFQSTAFSSLAAGSYTLMVKDANGCETTATVNISEPAVLTSNVTSTSDVDCNGNSTGSAVLDVTGGSTPYNYSLDGTTFNTSIDLTSLSAGAYTVTVRDANSCESTASFTITEPDVLGVSLGMVNDVSCNSGTDGSINALATGGTAPYQYAIDGTTFGTADTFTNLAAGSYTLTVQDANGCTATVAASVAEPAALALSFATVDISCNGGSDGEIAPATTGGTAPYEYSLDGTNFQSGAFTAQAAGTYTLTVRDASGCAEMASVTLTEPLALAGTVAVTNIDCFGESNGSVTITAMGGTAPYEYSTDASTFQSGDSFGNLAAGNYTITIRDANACTTTVAATVTEPTALTVSASVINDNTISVTASGGTAPYEYALDNGTFQSASTFSGLANGDYSITVRDANGCTVSTTSSLVITGTDDPFTPVIMSAYPNPVSDYLTFSRLAPGDEIRLVSLNGNSLDLTIIQEEKEEYRKNISGIRQKIFLAIVVSKEGRVKLNQKVMKKE